MLTLTDGNGSEARSAWYTAPVPTGSFTASFTYKDVGGGGSNGIAFVLQNDSHATAALGGEGAAARLQQFHRERAD